MGRAPCCDKANVKRGPWSPEEDATLKRYLQTYGTAGNWIALPQKAGLKRCGKSCRLRWLNYLRPDIKHGGFTEEEDKIIFTLYSQIGSRWSLIASHLPGRTDNDVKNYWNTKLKKKLLLGGNPVKNNTEITGHNSNANTAPCSTPSLPCVVPKTEATCSLTFWDSLSQSSLTLPILSDVASDQHLLSTSQSLSLDPLDQFYFTPGIMDNLSELGSTLINNHNLVSSSQEGSSISESSSIIMDHNNNCLSMPAGILMDSGFGFPYDPVTALLFEDKAGEVASTWCPNLGGFGYADMKH